jgi:hypothetical protein
MAALRLMAGRQAVSRLFRINGDKNGGTMRRFAVVLVTAGVLSAGFASVFAAAAAADQPGPDTSDSVRITNRDM